MNFKPLGLAQDEMSEFMQLMNATRQRNTAARSSIRSNASPQRMEQQKRLEAINRKGQKARLAAMTRNESRLHAANRRTTANS